MFTVIRVHDLVQVCIVGATASAENPAVRVETGQEANEIAKRLNDNMRNAGIDVRFRVQRIEEDNDSWRKREESRFESGEYIKTLFSDRHWYTRNEDTKLHYVHVSKKQPEKIAYTQSVEHGQADRQTTIRVGAYLTKYFSINLSPEEIAAIATEHAIQFGDDIEVTITQDADEIQAVYENGPNSCMAKSTSHFQGSCHPVRVYAGPDLALAYLGDKLDATARAIVWPKEKIYSTTYGDGTRLIHALEALGYNSGALDGARLQRIPSGDGFIMPYVDDCSRASDDGKYLVLDDSGDLDAQQTDGVACNGEFCEYCSGHSTGDFTYIESHGYAVCESCYQAHFFYCDSCSSYHHNDYSHSVHDGSVVCDVCAENHYVHCSFCEDLFNMDDVSFTEDGESACGACREKHCFECHSCNEIFDNNNKFEHETVYGESVCTRCSDKGYALTPCAEYIAESGNENTDCACSVCDTFRRQYVIAFSDDDAEHNESVSGEYPRHDHARIKDSEESTAKVESPEIAGQGNLLDSSNPVFSVPHNMPVWAHGVTLDGMSSHLDYRLHPAYRR